MAKREIVLESFEFTEEDPKFTPRTPYKWMSNDEKESIAHYPYILDAQCPFCASFKVDGNPVTLRGVVPKGFTYNLADICWLLEPLTYDKHSPFVKDASFIHDYMVSRKRELYEVWDLEAKGIKPLEFKKMTSMIFCHQLKQNGVPYSRAHLMSTWVDIWQFTVAEWYNLDKSETVL